MEPAAAHGILANGEAATAHPEPELDSDGHKSGASALDAIADWPRWVAWRLEPRKEGGKATKVPYNPRNGGKANCKDPRTWGTRAEAEARAKQLANGEGAGGVGIELGDLGTGLALAGIDLDSCLDERGRVAPWAERILAFLDTYTERSPSSTGLKAFFLIRCEDVRPFLDLIGVPNWGCRRAVGGNGQDHGPAVEVYCAERYFAVTGELWPGKPDAVGTFNWDELEALVQVVPRNGEGAGKTIGGRDDSRSADAFRKAAELRRGAQIETFEEMVEALRNDPDPGIRAWVHEKGMPDNLRELRRMWKKVAPAGGVALTDFYAYMPGHQYIFAPTGEMWPASSVNARIPPVPLHDAARAPILDHHGEQIKLRASTWLDQNRPVEQMTWAPGLPQCIQGRLVSEGGWIERPNVGCFNLYRHSTIKLGDPTVAKSWIDHVWRVYPDDAEHIIKYCAHRAQRPEEKINHALFLGGVPGIGKDTLLEPVKRAVGPWNWSDISPRHIFEPYNDFARAVILRISEARDLGEATRYQFYDHLKVYSAAPPDVLRINGKYLRPHYVFNCCGLIITSNYKTDGIYLPADDRRTYVAWSSLTIESFPEGYWEEIWDFLDNRGGDRHVAAYLKQLDLSGFNPKAPPPKTPAFWEIVNANRSPEDAEMADTFDALANPSAVTLLDLIAAADSHEFRDWMRNKRNRRNVGRRIEACGYRAVRNPDAKDELWKVEGRRQVIYARADLSEAEQLSAAQERMRRPPEPPPPPMSKEELKALKTQMHPGGRAY
jgi:hypothetical protein